MTSVPAPAKRITPPALPSDTPASARDLMQVKRARRSGTIRSAMVEGATSTPVLSASNNYITPFALSLNASSMQIGLLSAWPNLAAALAQFFAPAIGRRMGSRKGMLAASILLSIAAWTGMILLPFVVPGNKVWVLIGLATLALTAYHLPQGAFGSWISDMVPARRLGRVLGARTSLASIGTVAMLIGGGYVLDLFESRIYTGFAILFGAVVLLRLVSLGVFARMYEPPYTQTSSADRSLSGFVKNVIQNNLGHFLLAYGLLYFGVSISGPFFAVFMLRDLEFTYMTYMLVSMAATLVTLVAVLFWGPFADKFGNVRVLKVTIAMVAIVPLMWLFVDGAVKAYVVNMIAGAVWAGFNMASLNFVYEASAREERVRNVAYLFAFQGIASFMGSTLGGFIVPHVPQLMGSSYFTLFAISASVRFAASGLVFKRVHEVRHIAKGSGISLHLPKRLSLWMRGRVG